MAAEDIDIRIKATLDAAESAKTIGDLKKSIKDLNNLALETGDVTSDAFKQLTKAAGQASDKIADVKAATKELSGEPLQNLLKSFDGLKQSILSMDMKGFQASLGALKTSFIELGATILANPIFLLAAAIIAIVVAMYQLKDAGGAIGVVFDYIGEKVALVTKYLKDFLDYLGLTDFKGQEIAEKEKKRSKEVADEKEKQLKKEKDDQEKALKDKDAASEKAHQRELKRIEDEKKAREDSYNRQVAEKEKFYDTLEGLEDKFILTDRQRLAKSFDDQGLLLKGNSEREIAVRAEIEKRKNEALAAFDIKAAEDKKKITEQSNKDQLDLLDQLFSESEIKRKEANQKRLAESQLYLNQAKEIVSTITEAGAGIDSLGQNILNSFSNITSSLSSNFAVIGDQSASITDKINAGLQVAKDVVGEIGSILQASSERNIKNIEKEKSAKLLALQKQKDAGIISEVQLKSATGKINEEYAKKQLEAKRKAFNQDKAIRVVQAIIGTAQGVVSALANPFPLNIIMAALAGITGAVQIGVIASQKFPEGDSAGSGAVSVPSVPSAPDIGAGGGPGGGSAINPSSFFGLGQNNLISSPNSPDSRVYVVESDITNTQGRVRTIEDRSVLGG